MPRLFTGLELSADRGWTRILDTNDPEYCVRPAAADAAGAFIAFRADGDD
jgi:hypothetical protein